MNAAGPRGPVRRSGPPRLRRATRRRKILIASTIVFASLAMAVGIAVFASWETIEDRLRSRVERALSETTGSPARIATLRLRPFAAGVDVEGVELSIPSGASTDPVTVRLGRATIELAWTGLPGLATGSLHFREVTIDDFDVRTSQAFFDAVEASSAERGEPRGSGFRFRLDRLRLTRGRFGYEDLEVPIDVDVRGLDVRGDWAAYRKIVAGEVALTAEVALPGFRRRVPLELDAGLRVSASRVEVIAAEVRSPLANVEVERHVVSWGHGTLVNADAVVSEGDLERLADYLEDAPAGLRGQVDGRVAWSFADGDYQVRGRARGRAVGVGSFELDTADVDFAVQRDSVRARVLDASWDGGSVEARVEVPTSAPYVVGIEGTVERVPLASIFEALELPLPLRAQTAGRFVFRGDLVDPTTWNGEGTFRALSSDFGAGLGPGDVAVSGEGRFGIESGRLELDAPSVEAGGSDLELDLALDLSSTSGLLVIEGTTSDATRTQNGVARILRSLEVELPEPLTRPITGAGSISTTIVLGSEIADLAFDVDLTAGRWDDWPFSSLVVGIDLFGDALTIARLAVDGEEWTVRGKGAVDLDSPRLEQVDLRIVGLPVARILSALDRPEPVTGRLDVRVAISRRHGRVDGGGVFALDELEVAGRHLGAGRGELVVIDGAAFLCPVSLMGAGFDLHGTLEVAQDLGSARFDLTAGRLDLARLTAASGEGAGDGESGRDVTPGDAWLDGLVDLRGAVELDDRGIAGRIGVRSDGLTASDADLGPLDGEIAFASDRVIVDLGPPETPTWRLLGSADLRGRNPFRARLELDRYPFTAEAGLGGRVKVVASGRLELEGAAGAPPDTWIAEGTLTDVAVRAGLERLRSVGAVDFAYRNGLASFGPFRVEGGDTAFRGDVDYDVAAGSVNGSLEGEIDVGLLSRFAPAVSASGSVAVDVRFEGPAAAPRLEGNARIASGRARLKGFPHPLEGIAATVRLAGQEASISGLRAIIGGGELRGDGGVAFDGLTPSAYYLEATASNVRIRYPDGFRASYEGELLLRGDGELAKIDGEIEMLRGLYGEEIELIAFTPRATREYAPETALELGTKVALDLDVRAQDGVWIRNELAELETAFDLRLRGTIARPEVTGRLGVLSGGEITFRDVRYDITSATVDFVGLDRIAPYLSVRARTTVRQYEIFLSIDGPPDAFEYELRSNPALSEQDIIALLTTGSTLQELTETGAGGTQFTGDLAAGYFAGALTGAFEQQLERALGFERIELRPLLVGGSGDPTARVTLGKEVTDDVLLVYSSELGEAERQLYQVEWRASRKVRLTAGREITGGIGGDIAYTDRYWWKKPPDRVDRPDDSAAPRVIAPAARLESVEVLGVDASEEKNVRSTLDLEPGQRVRRSELFDRAQRLREKYVKRGKIAALVEVLIDGSFEGESVSATYRVEPGATYDVEFTGITKRDERRIRDALREQWSETVFAEDLVADSSERIRDFYRERGYYTVDVSARVAETEGDSARLRFAVDPGRAVRVKDVSIAGNDAIDDARIAKQMLTRSASIFARRVLVPSTLDEDVSAIRNLYRDQGFLDVRVEEPRVSLSTDGQWASVAIRIDEGSRYEISRVETAFEGDPPDVDVIERSGLEVGQAFSTQRLVEAESNVRLALDRRGYPDARVDARFARGDDSSVDVRLEIAAGAPRRVAEIVIVGNATTKEKIIRRELRFEVGDRLSREELLRTQHALYRLGIFRNVRIDYVPVGGVDGSAQRVRVAVEEARPFGVSAGVGYDTEAKFRGTISASHSNVGGYDRTLSLATRKSSIEERAQLVAEDPRLFARRWPALFSLLYEEREEVGYDIERRQTAFRVENRFLPKWTSYVRYGYQRINLFNVTTEGGPGLIERRLDDVVLGDLGYSIVWDDRDDPFLTRNGRYANLETRVFAPAFLSEETFVKVFLRMAQSKTFERGSTIATAIRIGVSETFGSTADVPLPERFFAGGDSTLRGFSRDRVGPLDADGDPRGGEGLALFNVEWRFPIWESLRGTLFYDAGNVYLDSADFDPLDLRHVVGAGLRLESPVGPIRVEYGRKLDREQGESAGELFVAIGAAF